jgi:Auxin binding protein
MRKTVDDRAALDDFMKTCSYPAYDGFVVKDVSDHPVHARAHRGNAGAYFNFKGLQALEAHISELPPGGCTKTHRHSCEALFYVLAGRGYTVVEEERERERASSGKREICFSLLCWPGIGMSTSTRHGHSVTSKSRRCR